MLTKPYEFGTRKLRLAEQKGAVTGRFQVSFSTLQVCVGPTSLGGQFMDI
jgi:hypothetical protein